MEENKKVEENQAENRSVVLEEELPVNPAEPGVSPEMEELRTELLSEAYRMIQDEVAEIHNDITREISVYKMQARREVMAERDYYVEQVFSDVRKELSAFKRSDGYLAYLKEAYQHALEQLGEITCVYVARPDLELVKCFADVPVKQDLRIIHGGLLAENDGLIADFTFDRKLKTAKERFNATTMVDVP